MTDPAILDFLRTAGLISADDTPHPEALTGGVSSDIWKIETANGNICIKRALSQLKTEKKWEAPVSRNASEADWIRTVETIAPDAVPEVLCQDRETGMFAMPYFDPEDYPVWKSQLRDGVVSIETAAAVGKTLGLIHAATADNEDIALTFCTNDIFHAIRIEPYLLRTAESCPDVAPRLKELAETTAANRISLVHGDVSPKNILAGPEGPVFLDAECAWYGEPAFDLAFCLNHLFLKCIWRPDHWEAYLESFTAMSAAYLSQVTWEPPTDIERRTAGLLAGLLLARIDGTSPVEYITEEPEKDRVRRAARRGLNEPPPTLAGMIRIFREETEL
ncbi:MAG: aminoglycoside phosphotransferase [Rhodospirillaceae bacterium]|nr:aminoglycoside phosphotransferase [Rhodospirillaceae bacterium]